MGLAVVHGIVASLGGAITVESVLGQGATFEVYVPRSDRTSATTVRQEEPLLLGTECILFVDDEEAVVRLAQEMLARFGYDMVMRTSSVEALEAFRANPARFDCVITDLTMPNMTGEFLAHELRRIRADIPIILCTGFSHTMAAEKAAALGIDAFCLKPIVGRELSLTIRQVLARRAATAPEGNNPSA
jgi:CheY-like chemotaxis protein